MTLSKETVRKLMMQSGLWIPRRHGAPKIQQPRYRRACVGELIQIDGCDHRWFEERRPARTLLVCMDDATNRLMQLHFVRSESMFNYYEATRGYLEQHGKPLAFYSDKASVFRINNKKCGWRRRSGAVWSRDERAAHHRHLRQHQFCQGPRGACASHVAGPAGQGNQAA